MANEATLKRFLDDATAHSARMQAFNEGRQESDDDASATALSDSILVKAGDYVNCRNPNGAEDVVVLGVLGNQDFVAILDSGETAVFRKRSAAMSHPDFCDPQLALKALLWQDETEREGSLKARVEILKAMRQYRKDSDRALYEIRQVAQGELYKAFRSPNPNVAEEVSVARAIALVRKLLGRKASEFPREMMAMATYKYMIEQSEFFIISNSRTDRFYVVPTAHIENLRRVNDWSRTNDVRLDSFIAKSREILQAASTRTAKTLPDGAIEADLLTTIQFSEDDTVILTFLQNSLSRTRLIQVTPYEAALVKIARGVGREYEGNSNFTFELLHELGVTPPWGDWLGGENVISKWEGAERLEEEAVGFMKQYHQLAGGPSTSLPKFGDGLDDQRHDWGDMQAFTVDDEGAHELDDGFSVEQRPDGTWMHIHIADPTALIGPDHALSHAARERGNSAYFADRSFSMLPSTFASYFSLDEGKAQPVITFSFKVDGQGGASEHVIRPAILRNNTTLTYNAMEDLLGNSVHRRAQEAFLPALVAKGASADAPPPALPEAALEKLRQITDATARMMQHRIRNGAYQMQFPSMAGVNVTPLPLPRTEFPPTHPVFYNGYPHIKLKTGLDMELDPASSRHTIAELMLQTNLAGGVFGQKHGIPLLHRVFQSSRYKEILGPLRDPETGLVPWTKEFRTIESISGYSVKPGGNVLFGVGNTPYARVSSPLRRYADLVNHWQLKAFFTKAPYPFTKFALEEMAVDLAVLEREGNRREKLNDAYWRVLKINREFAKDPSAFRKMKAMVISELRSDPTGVTLQFMRQIHVDVLGSRGSLVGLPRNEVEALVEGTEITVDLKSIKTGKTPQLEFVLSRDA